MRAQTFDRGQMPLRQKFREILWFLVLLLALIASVGFVMLYSAAGGSLDPWASRQMARFAFGVALLVAIAVTDIRVWFKYAYAAYGLALVLLIWVEVAGRIGMGAQRWLSFGIVNFQPSELMKVALLLTLAHYFHGGSSEDVRRPLFLVVPVVLVILPVGLVLRQPDLGTAMMLLLSAAALFFVAGVRIWKFVAVGLTALAAIPIAWQFLRGYQKKRVMSFLAPEQDPLGAGYHIIQSKIALGSGGFFGKGFLQGTQGHLSFLPEKQTDFIFTMLAEEFGMLGGLTLLALYALVLLYAYAIAFSCRNHFGRMLAMGVASMFFLYVFINIAMVLGLVPVVGVPLPLVSYGGTSMLTILIAFGLLLNAHVHRDVMMGRLGGPVGI
ncbi:MAG: rod shape-determining protein RodA [Acidimicrobiia bacterium]|nr:rod shape-determining protein RodA [Acidimicrobiia bacterium]